MLEAPAVKVQNLLNRNDGALQNNRVEFTSVTGADGYKIYRSMVPYGNFTEVADIPVGTTTWVDETPTIESTNDAEPYEVYVNELTILQRPNFYYSVAAYTVDENGDKEVGEQSRPTSPEDAVIACAADRDSIYTIGDFPIYSCGTGAPIPSANQLLPYLSEIRRRTLSILQMDGQWVWLLKRRVYGERCPNCDDDNNKCKYGTRCPTCFGTDMRDPFLPPVLIKVVMVYGDKKEEYEDLGIRTVRESKSWTIWQPKLAPRDVIVDHNGERYDITAVEKTSPMLGGMYARQDFKWRLLEMNHAFYRIDVPGPLPLA